MHDTKRLVVCILLSLSVLMLVSGSQVAGKSNLSKSPHAIGNDQNSGASAKVTLNPTSGSIGTFVVVTGVGFGDGSACPISSFPIGLVTKSICALDLGVGQMSGSFIVGNVPPGHYVVQVGYDASAIAGFNVTSSGSSTTTVQTSTVTTATNSIVETSVTSSAVTSTTNTITTTVTRTVQSEIQTSLYFGSVVATNVVITVSLIGSSHGLVGPISGQSVSVSSNWSGGSCITNANGNCQVTLSKPAKGNYSINVKFAGNSYFLSSVATGTVAVK
ncbi:MAG TPA: hypothetical protein VEH56_03545 [Candidatus Saccharimonadales bacterium]|nr:hypothetical protein [Candidatus Saccharimonadales bacterium]